MLSTRDKLYQIYLLCLYELYITDSFKTSPNLATSRQISQNLFCSPNFCSYQLIFSDKYHIDFFMNKVFLNRTTYYFSRIVIQLYKLISGTIFVSYPHTMCMQFIEILNGTSSSKILVSRFCYAMITFQHSHLFNELIFIHSFISSKVIHLNWSTYTMIDISFKECGCSKNR